jgi:hypothetical protein
MKQKGRIAVRPCRHHGVRPATVTDNATFAEPTKPPPGSRSAGERDVRGPERRAGAREAARQAGADRRRGPGDVRARIGRESADAAPGFPTLLANLLRPGLQESFRRVRPDPARRHRTAEAADRLVIAPGAGGVRATPTAPGRPGWCPTWCEVIEDSRSASRAPGTSSGSPNARRCSGYTPMPLVIVYGHPHRPLLTLVDTVVTVMNPGEAGQRRFDCRRRSGSSSSSPAFRPGGGWCRCCQRGRIEGAGIATPLGAWYCRRTVTRGHPPR